MQVYLARVGKNTGLTTWASKCFSCPSENGCLVVRWAGEITLRSLVSVHFQSKKFQKLTLQDEEYNELKMD